MHSSPPMSMAQCQTKGSREVDDQTVSEVVRKPTRTAGDLSEVAGASEEITLDELLLRVRRIEKCSESRTIESIHR